MAFDEDDPNDPIYGYDLTVDDEFLRLSNPTHIEKAWRAVQTELEPGWTVAGVQREGRRPGGWLATATGPGKAGLTGYGDTPAWALADLLSQAKARKSEALKKTLPPPW